MLLTVIEMKKLLLIPLTLMLAGCLDDAPETDDAIVADEFVPEALGAIEWSAAGMAAPAVQDPAGATPCGEATGAIETHTWTIPAEVDGQAAKISTLLVEMTWMTPADLDLFIKDPDGTVVASSTAWNVDTQTYSERAQAANLPGGDYTIEVVTCTGGGDYDLTGTAEMVSVQTLDATVEDAEADEESS